MLNSHLNTEKQDLLITPNLQPNQLPTLLEQAVSVAPVGETRDMLLLSLLTNCGYALPAMRMPVIMKRIGMILTGLRLDMKKPLPERVVCSEEDFQTMLLIGHKLLMHAAMVFQMMPELKATPVGEIGGNMLQKQFFQMLPTDFTKQEAIQQAEVLGVALSTMERWITKSVQTAHIERLATGLYRKKPSCIA
ncbi:MAG: hypothetical protein IKW35_09320 [Paludibacteraceae bacterium]|nr:hypothetical protein [Paludibacteraceae bacterium]